MYLETTNHFIWKQVEIRTKCIAFQIDIDRQKLLRCKVPQKEALCPEKNVNCQVQQRSRNVTFSSCHVVK